MKLEILIPSPCCCLQIFAAKLSSSVPLSVFLSGTFSFLYLLSFVLFLHPRPRVTLDQQKMSKTTNQHFYFSEE